MTAKALICLFLTVVLLPVVIALCVLYALSLTPVNVTLCSQLIAFLCAWQLIAGTIALNLFAREFLRLRALSGRLGNLLENDTAPKVFSLARLERLILELLRSRQEFVNRERAIAEAASEIVCSLNEDLRLIGVNAFAQSLLGRPSIELIGKHLADLVLPEDADRTSKLIRSARQEASAVTFENRALVKGGKAADLQWSIEWSQSQNCYFACARDISDQKTLERAKREFVAMIGHDIRIPLGAALLSLETTTMHGYGEVPEWLSSILDRILRSLARLVTLINELLEFEKMSAGKMKLELRRVNVEELLQPVIADIRELATRRKIEIKCTVPPITVDADPGKLSRVFLNLISNAIKFSPENTTIEVTATQEPEFVEIRVKDHGPGIAAEYQQLVFERYERIDSQGSAIEGTGLGLAITKAIVQSHQGMIGVESVPGSGSTFWITLPRM